MRGRSAYRTRRVAIDQVGTATREDRRTNYTYATAGSYLSKAISRTLNWKHAESDERL